MSNIQMFLGRASFRQKTTGGQYNFLSSFGYSPTSSFFTIKGEGTNRENLIEKYNDFMGYIQDLYEANKKIKNDPLLARRHLTRGRKV